MNDPLSIALLDFTEPSGPEAHGKSRLAAALSSAGAKVDTVEPATDDGPGLLLVLGGADVPEIRAAADANAFALPDAPESTLFRLIRWDGSDALLASGADSCGVMYCLLELAERVRLFGLDALRNPKPFEESPRLRVRGVDRFIAGHLDDEWFHSDAFWTYFLDRLAVSRLNRFVLITGFDTAWMSPPYPFFVEVPGYEGIAVKGLLPDAKRRNLERLRAIGRECAMRSIEFFFGIWQQVPWQKEQSRIVEGLSANEDALAAYCAAGLREMVVQCPEIDGIHLRVNHESGVGTQQTPEGFWNTLTDAVADCGRPVKLDLRAKGLSDGMIRHAVDRGLEVAVPTKYWCEQTGLPHHLTRMRSEELQRLDNLNHSRRYSYSDLLRKPRQFDILYRLWNLGATNLFTWGDPDFVRRFCASMEVGDSPGFEFSCPLSLKYGHELHHDEAWSVHVDPGLRCGRFEDERYWYQFLLFGRIGYDPETGDMVLFREFAHRFGPEAGRHLAEACASASRVIPLITAAHMPAHPMLHYWPELSSGGALFEENHSNPHFRSTTYGAAEPSDPGLFYGIDEFAADLAAGTIRDKYTPLQVSRWLRILAVDTRTALNAAVKAPDLKTGPEWRSATTDFFMVADLAEYHAEKFLAALHLAAFRNTGAPEHLKGGRLHFEAARRQWTALAEKGQNAYRNPLDFRAGPSVGRFGHWKDALEELNRDLASLSALEKPVPANAKMTGVWRPDDEAFTASAFADAILEGELTAPETAPARRALPVRFTPAANALARGLNLRYRRTNQTEGPFLSVPMEREGDAFTAEIPAEYVIPEFDLLIYITARPSPHETNMHPGLWHLDHSLPYRLIRVEE